MTFGNRYSPSRSSRPSRFKRQSVRRSVPLEFDEMESIVPRFV
jgi:hypothetical protein